MCVCVGGSHFCFFVLLRAFTVSVKSFPNICFFKSYNMTKIERTTEAKLGFS